MILPVLRKKVTTRKDRTTRESTRKAAWPAGGEQREGVKTHGQVLLSGLRVEVIAKGMRGFQWCIWMSRDHSQGRSRRGTCIKGQPYHIGSLAVWVWAHNFSVKCWGSRKTCEVFKFVISNAGQQSFALGFRYISVSTLIQFYFSYFLKG